MKRIIILILMSSIVSCTPKKDTTQTAEEVVEKSEAQKTADKIKEIDYDVSKWMELTEEDGVVLDIRYSTENNFTEKQIYPCGRCFLRPELASKLKTLQKDIFKRYAMRLKLFDCYRPKPAQQKLWDIVPDPKYVTNPAKGSMHSRGLAVDITLVDSEGQELDMGAGYDEFTERAHSDHKNLPKEALKNRKILNKMMDIHGLKGIRTEWWHFSLKTVQAPMDEWEWPCDS